MANSEERRAALQIVSSTWSGSALFTVRHYPDLDGNSDLRSEGKCPSVVRRCNRELWRLRIKLTGTHASQHLFRKVWLELRQRLAVYCDARLRLLDEPQHRRTRGLDDRCDLCRLTATPNHELGGSVDAPRCAGEHPRKAAGQIWGQKRDLNPSAAAIGNPLLRFLLVSYSLLFHAVFRTGSSFSHSFGPIFSLSASPRA